MYQKGTPGVKSQVVLTDGQRFESFSAFARACGLSYPQLWRRMRKRRQKPDDIAREKGVLRTQSLAAE